jgi:type I restriction enzyme S subunit
MAREWSEQLLCDLLVTTKDGDWGKENPEEGFVPYHIIRGTDFPDVRVGDLSSVPLRYLPEHTVQRRTLEPDDIVIETAGGTRDRPTGRTLLVTEEVLKRFDGPVTCASFARFLRIDREQADPRFVFWYLQHLYNKGEMSQHQVQHTGVARFQYTRFAETQHVPLPPLPEQKAIAAVLGSLDDKIELNRRTNATLEAMARALFQSWFVDFDPVRAKLDGRKPDGLDKVIAALFPAAFHDSPLGPIPRGWEVVPLKDLTSKIGSGATPRGGSAVYVDEGVALIRSQNIYDHDFRWNGLARLSDQSAAELENVEVKAEDVLFNITGDSILRTCVVEPSVLPARVNQHVAIIRAKPPVPSRYIHLYMVQPRIKEFLLGMNAGATRPAVTKGHLESVLVVHPSPEVMAAFDVATAPMFRQIDTNRAQSRTLATLRDTLLPKLLSGELPVRD